MQPRRYSLRSASKAKRSSGDGRAGSMLLTVVLSLISGIAGVVVGQGIDFFKTRELQREQERAQIHQRVWVETTEIYRQLYSMRARLNGSIIAYRFAVIELTYLEANRAKSHSLAQSSDSSIADQRKIVDVASQQIVHDRTDLESLLGWVDLAAPADRRWGEAIQSLVQLERWSPSAPGEPRNLADWREAERLKAHQRCTKEINAKFAGLLTLLRENRRELALAAAPQ